MVQAVAVRAALAGGSTSMMATSEYDAGCCVAKLKGDQLRMCNRLIGRVVSAILMLGFAANGFGQEELCAEVRIEILQELTLERQGFEAIMRITNSLDTFPLEDIRVTVNFADQDGLPVTATSDTASSDAAFFIRLDDSRNVAGLSSAADGVVNNGSIAQGGQGEIRWLIIPTANAAGQTQNGKLYFVGATLTYQVGGDEEVVEVAPDSIVVKPQPSLTLDYFLTRHIIADDAFTPEIEPPEPYTLGVRVTNSGFGVARNLAIESAQPRIVENELGLAVDFKILRSYLQDQAAAPTLAINFGDIPSQSVSVGRWIMETSLSGEFTAFTASFTHSDELGGQLTSLLQATNPHFLIKDVRADLPGRDGVKDFLATDQANDLFVYESEQTGLNEALCINCAPVARVSGSLSGQGSSRSLSASASSGFSYIKVPDPFAGSQALSAAIRSDGKLIRADNAWLSKERADDNISFDYFINVFDSASTGNYTLNFGAVSSVPQPPVIQTINPRTTYEGGSIGFLVQSSDPNNTVPGLSATSLPAGAQFSDSGNGSGVFQWDTELGQAGSYTVAFIASDGQLQTERTVYIQVNPADDRDGDGLADDWELENFGDLSRDGSGDFDGDGRSDLEEYEVGSNPALAEAAPGEPQIASPIYDAEILAGASAPLLPQLTLSNAENNGAGALQYRFEIYRDVSLNSLIASSLQNEAGVESQWQLAETDIVEGQSFQDNTLYYWRARAEATIDGAVVPSQWVLGRFFINTLNDAPSVPQISSPAIDAVVGSLRPTLVVTNAFDPDRDSLSYGFKLYSADDLSTPLMQINGIFPGAGGSTQWQVANPLQEDSSYAWEAWVEDEHGLRSTSEMAPFFVSTVNSAPSDPVVSSPLPGEQVSFLLEGGALDLQVLNAEDPEQQALRYFFELDTVDTFNSPDKRSSPAIPEGSGTTAWQVQALVEDLHYYWRVKASDGVVDSNWVNGDFTVTLINQAPPRPTLNNPGDGSVVTTLQPLFEVNPVSDPEGDTVQYRYEIYNDPDLTSLLASHLSTATQWAVDFDLADNSEFFWRVRAEDAEQEASDWTPATGFFVNENNRDDEPQFSFVLPDAAIVADDPNVTIQWTDSDPDSDASITLYYLDGNSNQVAIASGIHEDLDGSDDSYLWDTSALLPGSYSLRAQIADASTTINVDACCTVTVPLQDKSISVTPLSVLASSESGEPWLQVEVVLDHALHAGTSLTINTAINDSTELALVSNAYLYFTADNWSQPQLITLKGRDDCEIDGDQQSTLSFGSVVSDDPSYAGLTLESLQVVNADDEQADQTLFICDYQLESQTAVANSSLVDHLYTPILDNRDISLESASAQVSIISSSDPDYSLELMGDGLVEFGELQEASTTLASNGIVLRYNPAQGLDRAKLSWTILPGAPLSDDIEGDAGDNTLYGTDGDDVMDGKAGNDTLYGGAGADQLTGGSGADSLYGEAGDDAFIIEGNDPYADRVFGGEGYDQILGGSGDDAIRLDGFFEERSVEEIDGQDGDNVIYGTANNDRLDFTHTILNNISRIDGLAGNDQIHGSQSADVIVGNGGNDQLYGNGGDDSFLIEGADAGVDRINGGEGGDQILGSDQDDVLRLSYFAQDDSVEHIDLGAGTNKIEGNNGNNTLDFTNTTINNVVHIDGREGNDQVYGSAGDDRIIGNLGNDYLEGKGGNDTFVFTNGDEGFDRYVGGDGTDTLIGTAMDDTFRIPHFSDAFTVEMIDGDGGFNRITGSAANNTLDFSDTQLIAINEILGAGGNDTIRGSQSGDVIIGGPGNDRLYGNGGDDTFLQSADDEGFNRYSGGDGTDRLLGTDGDDLFRMPRFNGEYTVEIIDGLAGGNAIVGNAGNNSFDFRATQLVNIESIQGAAGNDLIYGSNGDDLIIGGDGNDQLYGEGGNDIFRIAASDEGFNRYSGGDGVDRIEGSGSDDIIQIAQFSASDTVEIIDGAGGVDVIVGNNSNNLLDFTGTELINIARIEGRGGNDTLRGSAGKDTLAGGEGNDSLYGNAGDDTFLLTETDLGTNHYDGGDGFDRLLATANDDLIRIAEFKPSHSLELIDGNGGIDTIEGNAANNHLDFSATTLTGIASIKGLGGNDAIYGSAGDDVIVGGAGNDELYGNAGDDRFLMVAGDNGVNRYNGGEGFDRLDGSADDDIFRMASFSGDNTVEMIDGMGGHDSIQGSAANNHLDFSATQLVGIAEIDAGSGNDTVMGSQGDDLITGGEGSDYLYGNGGDDRFLLSPGDSGYDRYDGGDGTDRIEGGAGDDIIRLAAFSAGNSVEIIDGVGGMNVIQGNNSNNHLDFSATQLINIASINGGAGNDTIIGSMENDTLVGGSGNDQLYGGGGSDRYVFAPNDGSDTIYEEDDPASIDTLQFTGSVAAKDIWLVRADKDLVVYLLGANNQIRIPHSYTEAVSSEREAPVDSGTGQGQGQGSGKDKNRGKNKDKNKDKTKEKTKGNAKKYRVERIQTASGETLDTASMNRLVNLMTAIGTPTAGSIELTAEQQQELDDAINAVWH